MKNLLNRICHSIESKSVSDEKYIKLHEMIESTLMITTGKIKSLLNYRLVTKSTHEWISDPTDRE